MRLREKYQLKNIELEKIIKETAPVDEELIVSLSETEQYEPIKVTLKPDTDMYMLIDGRRRVEAAELLGWTQITAIIINDVSPEELHLRALVANAGKPNPMDECDHMLYLQEQGWSREKIASYCRYEKTKVDWILHLQKLIPQMKALVRMGTKKRAGTDKVGLPYTTGYEISRLPHDQQEILYKQWEEGQKLSQPYVLQFIRAYQASLVGDLGGDGGTDKEKVKPGLFIKSDQLAEVIAGTPLVITYEGVELKVQLNG